MAENKAKVSEGKKLTTPECRAKARAKWRKYWKKKGQYHKGKK